MTEQHIERQKAFLAQAHAPLAVTRTERANPHSEGACFVRETLLEYGQTRILVSTTGHQKFGFVHYETMALHADVDSVSLDSFEDLWYLECSIPTDWGDGDARANDTHESALAEITADLESGTACEQSISHIVLGEGNS